jgi:hypothetical protein
MPCNPIHSPSSLSLIASPPDARRSMSSSALRKEAGSVVQGTLPSIKILFLTTYADDIVDEFVQKCVSGPLSSSFHGGDGACI